MDTVFQDEIARANFLQSVMQNTFGCSYICMWSYFQQPNCLLFLDGYYHEENNQPSSSSGRLARRFFDDYCQSLIPVAEYDRVPGFAFKNGQQYIELNESELQRLASTELQRLFYQEARIKTAVFMACKTGEIELGFLSGVTPINTETDLRNLFQKDLSQLSPVSCHELPLPGDPAVGRPDSSSSSSIRSLSIDSPSEYSNSILFNIPTTCHVPQTLTDVPSLQPLIQTTTSPTQQAIHTFAQLQNIQETKHAAMTTAILAVLTSPSSSSSSSSQQINFPPKYPVSPKASAFKHYNLAFAPTISHMRTTNTSLRAQSMLKRAISYYSRLNMARREYVAASRTTTTQLHHMISERKRREKLNESFQALRSLLPPGTKKDKASLLISTREYLSSLKAQIDDLSRRNQILESNPLPAVKASTATEEASASSSSTERVEVRITPVSESTDSEWRIIDIGVTVRGESHTQLDLVMRILEFLKQVKNISLMSVEANTQIAESSSSSSNHIILRLRIQRNEWDESAFQEAVRTVVADLGQSQVK